MTHRLPPFADPASPSSLPRLTPAAMVTRRAALRALAGAAVASAGVVATGTLGACASPPPPRDSAPRKPEVRPYTGPVIDLHARVDLDGSGHGGSADVLLQQSRVDRVAAIAAVVLAVRPGMEATRRRHEALRELAARDKRVLPVGSVHPADGAEAVAEVDRLGRSAFRMLKLDPNIQQLDLASAQVAAVVDKAGEMGLPVLIDWSGVARARELTPYLTLARTHARTRFVLARMGGTQFKDILLVTELWGEGKPPHNVFFDLSASARLFASSPWAEQLVWVVRQVGIERVLFGSDFPAQQPMAAIDDLIRLGFSQEEQRRLFYVNAATLLNIAA